MIWAAASAITNRALAQPTIIWGAGTKSNHRDPRHRQHREPPRGPIKRPCGLLLVLIDAAPKHPPVGAVRPFWTSNWAPSCQRHPARPERTPDTHLNVERERDRPRYHPPHTASGGTRSRAHPRSASFTTVALVFPPVRQPQDDIATATRPEASALGNSEGFWFKSVAHDWRVCAAG
jgi:hypothetical protein